MEHVVVRWGGQPAGYWLDPSAYLEVLPQVADTLPPGARDYAQAAGHYDFYSERCVKDLGLASLHVDDALQRVTIDFTANQFKHTEGLALVYVGVRSVSVECSSTDGLGRMCTVLLDEILPLEGGASHEIALIGGAIKVVASDIEARWH